MLKLIWYFWLFSDDQNGFTLDSMSKTIVCVIYFSVKYHKQLGLLYIEGS